MYFRIWLAAKMPSNAFDCDALKSFGFCTIPNVIMFKLSFYYARLKSFHIILRKYFLSIISYLSSIYLSILKKQLHINNKSGWKDNKSKQIVMQEGENQHRFYHAVLICKKATRACRSCYFFRNHPIPICIMLKPENMIACIIRVPTKVYACCLLPKTCLAFVAPLKYKKFLWMLLSKIEYY